MPYLRPPMVVKALYDPMAIKFKLGGAVALSVAGSDYKVPVLPVSYEGALYVVSSRGEAQWVKDVRTMGKLSLGEVSYAAQEVPVTDRIPVIDAYRRITGRASEGHWRRLPDPADHPVFRLTPR